MPLVAHTKLPSFERLRSEGENVLDANQAILQEIRELHIGLLNMMPDAALAATERQFLRLIGGSNQIAQFYVHPFTLKELPRAAAGQAHVDTYYETFEDIKKEGLDALIITGANVTQPELTNEPFWEPLIEVIDWAYDNVTSILCSCLATHAVMQFRYQQKRKPLGFKRWGVFQHNVLEHSHPLVTDVNTQFDVPHSRYNDISKEQFEAAGLKVLVESVEAGVHLAVSEDLFRIVYFQGHPEYDTVSLLKEYKREVLRYFQNDREEYPPFPKGYFRLASQAILLEFKDHVIAAKNNKSDIPVFPEKLIIESLQNTWRDTAESVIDKWIGKVYQVTSMDRKEPFMKSVDPKDPLNLK